MKNEPFDTDRLAPLTNLQTLNLATHNETPLDLSGLSALTYIHTYGSPVARLPTSLVRCQIRVEADIDMFSLTRLTRLELTVPLDVRVTLPTQLEELHFSGEASNLTNISDVGLEVFFNNSWKCPLTREMLDRLPKTLVNVGGSFEPWTLKDQLGEIPLMYDEHLKNVVIALSAHGPSGDIN